MTARILPGSSTTMNRSSKATHPGMEFCSRTRAIPLLSTDPPQRTFISLNRGLLSSFNITFQILEVHRSIHQWQKRQYSPNFCQLCSTGSVHKVALVVFD